jgi:hypothetical protein
LALILIYLFEDTLSQQGWVQDCSLSLFHVKVITSLEVIVHKLSKDVEVLRSSPVAQVKSVVYSLQKLGKEEHDRLLI